MSNQNDVRAALDAAPEPSVRPVDLAALYRAALDRQARVARRWRRAAVAVAALAAAVAIFALIPKLDVRVNAHEFVVRWGLPQEEALSAPSPDPRLAELCEEQASQLVALRAANAKNADLQDLILTVARDVADRDDAQKVKVAALSDKLRDFETLTAKQFQDADRTNTALYNVVFHAKPKPDGAARD